MDKSQSPPVGLSNPNLKARRLKILQELEDRKLQLSNERLSRAQRKVCRQLELQRMQFTRRFSESSFNPALLQDGPGLEASQFGNSTEFDSNLLVSPNPHTESDSNKQEQPDDQPFWLRLRSLGVVPDEDYVSKTSCDTNLKTKMASAENLCATNSSEDKNSISNDTVHIVRRTISVVPECRIRPGVSLEDFTSKDPDLVPAWLVALNQLRRDRADFSSGKRAELAALVSGNKVCDAKNFVIPNLNTSTRRDSKATKPHKHSVIGLSR